MIAAILAEILKNPNITDIHLAVRDQVWVREHGDIRPFGDATIQSHHMESYLGKVLAPAMSWDDFLSARQGSHDFAQTLDGCRLRCHLSYHGPNTALCLSIRRLRNTIPFLSELGLPSGIERFFGETKGLLLITGSVNSGKSTTLAAGLDYINRTRCAHILTLEDPIEYLLVSDRCRVMQKEIGEKLPSLEAALIGSKREDPNILMIGEIRTRETMHGALSAANSGNFVLATLHTASGQQTIDRVTSFYPEQDRDEARHLLASNLTAILCQSLVKRQDREGLVLVYEILVNHAPVREAILSGKTQQIPNIMETGRLDGHVMQHWVLKKMIDEGTLAEETAMAMAHSREKLRQAISRP
ncbi:MAG: Flp pilus assembly complex ATPase component TadA [Pseudomonadota bacterium]|nr:Flp pilus assembly complex ATPase component TadA [Pseudomonadota bacterium]